MELRQSYLIFLIMALLAAAVSLGSISLTGWVSHEEVLPEPALPEPAVVQNQVAVPDPIESVRSSVNQLRQEVTNLQGITEKNEREISRITGNVQGLSAQVSQLQQSVQDQIKSVSTGLAGLQKNVESEFTNLKADSKQKRTSLLILAIILASLAGLLAFYFYHKKSAVRPSGIQPQGDSRIMDYITHHIKQGKKYPHIQQNLQRAGWQDQDIRKAYQDTLKRNYHFYKKKNNSVGSENQSQIKIIGLVGAIVIFTGIIIFFAFGTSTGQAYQKYGGVDDYEEGTGLNRVLSEQQCFPPRIMVNGQCCDDRNQNTACDTAEGYTEAAASSASSLAGSIAIRAATPQDSVQRRQISVTAASFEPAQLSAVQGDNVEFTNNRNEPVRIIPGSGCPPLDSQIIAPSATFAWVPSVPGTCQITTGAGVSGEPCNDNQQCAGARDCVENQCRFIADLYQTASCSEYCTIVRVQVSTSNLDPSNNAVQQNYTLRMGLGSYTAGGALDWTIKPIPDFCKPSSATRIHQQSNTWRANIPIPFEIREFSNSELLGTRVETVVTGQQKEIGHRSLSLDEFILRVEDVHLTCGEHTVFS